MDLYFVEFWRLLTRIELEAYSSRSFTQLLSAHAIYKVKVRIRPVKTGPNGEGWFEGIDKSLAMSIICGFATSFGNREDLKRANLFSNYATNWRRD